MKRLLASLLLAAFAATTAFGYDHTSYNQTGLVIQYDAEGNGANAPTLVNLGSAGSAFNLAAQTSNDKVEDGVIKVDHLAEGNYKNHGWAYSSAESANCDWFFTTDNGILKKAKALTPMHIANPLSFFRAVAVGQTLDLEKGRRLPHLVGGHKVVFAGAVPPMRVKRPDSTNSSRCQRHSPCPVHFSIDATRRGNARWVRHRVR